MNNSTMKDVVHSILSEIVEDVAGLNVEEKAGNNSSAISIVTNRADTGKIIGKAGNTIKSLRAIIRAIGAKRNIRCNLYIID